MYYGGIANCVDLILELSSSSITKSLAINIYKKKVIGNKNTVDELRISLKGRQL